MCFTPNHLFSRQERDEMAEFMKLDLVDNDEHFVHVTAPFPPQSTVRVEWIKAKDLKSLIKSELKKYIADDRLESCCEEPRARQFSISGNSIKCLVDGSCTTIAVYIESPRCFESGNGPTLTEIKEYFKDFI